MDQATDESSQLTKMNSVRLGPSWSLTPDPPGCMNIAFTCTNECFFMYINFFINYNGSAFRRCKIVSYLLFIRILVRLNLYCYSRNSRFGHSIAKSLSKSTIESVFALYSHIENSRLGFIESVHHRLCQMRRHSRHLAPD